MGEITDPTQPASPEQKKIATDIRFLSEAQNILAIKKLCIPEEGFAQRGTTSIVEGNLRFFLDGGTDFGTATPESFTLRIEVTTPEEIAPFRFNESSGIEVDRIAKYMVEHGVTSQQIDSIVAMVKNEEGQVTQ